MIEQQKCKRKNSNGSFAANVPEWHARRRQRLSNQLANGFERRVLFGAHQLEQRSLRAAQRHAGRRTESFESHSMIERMYRCNTVDKNVHSDALLGQIERRLQHTDVRFDAAQQNGGGQISTKAFANFGCCLVSPQRERRLLVHNTAARVEFGDSVTLHSVPSARGRKFELSNPQIQ